VKENQVGDFLAMHKRKESGWAEKTINSTMATNEVRTQQDNMELWGTISNLASANQQLAAAHSLTLDHLQWFFDEFRKPQRHFIGCEFIEKRRPAKTSCSGTKNKESQAKSIGKYIGYILWTKICK
jgi:hypothetical protein